MDYSQFLGLRERAWEDFRLRLEAARRSRKLSYADLEELALQYRLILYDHAFASWRFAGTGAARRLARLALDGTRWLYASGEEREGRFRLFWTKTFPTAFRRTAGTLVLTLSIFFVAALFGLFLATVQTGVAVALLGPAAVEGLERGHLWTESLVTTVPPTVSSSAIATNNVSVALTAWAGGALGGLGSLYIVLFNGFLLGALIGVTLHYSMALQLLAFVAAHGPLEITLILVTAAAGLQIGRAMISAGDRPRDEALREAAKESLSVILGCAPWFFLLAVVESFLSPAPDVAPAMKVAVGIALETLFLWVAWNPLLTRREAA
jgi:uncharacterized membrane protein SpoIIM required for sporulation